MTVTATPVAQPRMVFRAVGVRGGRSEGGSGSWGDGLLRALCGATASSSWGMGASPCVVVAGTLVAGALPPFNQPQKG